jgi:hypothetical protein
MTERARLRQKAANTEYEGSRSKVQQVTESIGNPLPAQVLTQMESYFGHNFSNVRVHADAIAAESARALHANAYATGSHLVFGAGKYDLSTEHGRTLIAHELAHVVQQSYGPASCGTEDRPSILRDSSLESEARHAGVTAAKGHQTFVTPAHTVSAADINSSVIQCEEDEDKSWMQTAMHYGGGAASKIGDFFGLEPLSFIGEAAEASSDTVEGVEAGAKGDTFHSALGLAKSATGITSLAAGMGGFSMWGEGGILGALGNLGSWGTVEGLGPAAGEGAVGATLDASAAWGGAGAAGLEGAAALGPFAAVAASLFGGIEAGDWMSKNTSAGETATDTWGVMDKGLGWLGEGLGLRKEGDQRSALLEATEWAEDHPLGAVAAAPLAIPALLAGGVAAGTAGLVSGVGDLAGRGIDWLEDLF